jgi:3',5'-cyclic-AMP phosphodiesterase
MPRCRVVPGNHDNRAGLRKVFPEIVSSPNEFLSFAEAVGDWRVLGLDTHWPGEVPGRMNGEQLDWLSHQLKQFPAQPTLVFLHHPPVSVNSPWLDKIGLQDAEPFRELIAAHPQIQAIATGHVHHVFQGKLGQADVLTTPSTAVQFVPGGEESAYAHDPPGYRVFDLKENDYRTRVHRLPVLRYPPSAE